MEKELLDLFRQMVMMHRNKVQEYLKTFDLYLGQQRILFELQKNPKITLTELTEKLQVSKESLSVSIKRLEGAGFINKVKDDKDKRRILLELSEKGYETATACKKGFENLNQTMFQDYSKEDKQVLGDHFKRMIENLERI